MKLSDFTLALLLLALAAAMSIAALSFPPMPGQAFGPKLFPNIVAAGLALCAVGLIVRARRSRDTSIRMVRPEWWNEPGRRGNLLMLLGSIVAYTLLVERAGFLLTTLALLMLLMKRLGASWRATLLASVTGTALTYVMFAQWLRVPLPRGILAGLWS